MTKQKLISSAKFNDTDLRFFKELHPNQIINEMLEIGLWEIEYSYTTVRNNDKIGKKYLLLDYSDWDKVENEFISWLEKFNRNNPERKLLNVEILDSEFLGNICLDLE